MVYNSKDGFRCSIY